MMHSGHSGRGVWTCLARRPLIRRPVDNSWPMSGRFTADVRHCGKRVDLTCGGIQPKLGVGHSALRSGDCSNWRRWWCNGRVHSGLRPRIVQMCSRTLYHHLRTGKRYKLMSSRHYYKCNTPIITTLVNTHAHIETHPYL